MGRIDASSGTGTGPSFSGEARTRIRLCGRIGLEFEGTAPAAAFHGRQARLVASFLLTHRARTVDRHELISMLWPACMPKDPQADLRPILTGIRRALAPGVLEGRDQLRLVLPEPVWVDVEVAIAEVEASHNAAGGNAWRSAIDHGRGAADLLKEDFLPGLDAGWVLGRRRELEEARCEALELVARGGLTLGGSQMRAAQQAARQLVACSPYRETGYRYLMEAFAAQGNVAEALRAYEGLRRLLHDELGADPNPELQALHASLLQGGARTAIVAGPPPLPAGLLHSVERGAFVGREPELERFGKAWANLTHGPVRPVLLVGEAGIGKTRTVAEFAQAIHRQGTTVLYGRCDEERMVGYQPFVEALDGWAAACPLDELRLRVGPIAADLAGLVPEIAHRLPGSSSKVPVDTELERFRLVDAVRRVLAALAAETPVLLVLDDLHWSDRSTLLLLRHLVRTLGSAPLLVLGTLREEGLEPTHPLTAALDDLRRDQGYERVGLTGLEEREAAGLIAALAGSEPPADVVRAIQEETDGNPFFIEALVRHLTEGAPAGRWPRGGFGVPEGVKQLTRRRLASLDEPAVRLLQIASVVGRDFALPVLDRVVGGHDEVADSLEQAVLAGFVEEAPGSPNRYRFVHALIRNSLYEQLTGVRRGRLHRQVAAALEQLDGDQQGFRDGP